MTDILVPMLLISAASMALLGLYGWRMRASTPAAVPYSVMMAAFAWWAFVYALEILVPALQDKILCHNLRFISQAFIPILELWLVLEYARLTRWMNMKWAGLLLIIPVITVILALTSPYQSLFRYAFSIDTTGPVPVVQFSQGPFFWIYFAYGLVLLIISYGVLINESRKRESLFEAQTILLFIALIIPTVVTSLFNVGITPVPGVNLTTPTLWVSAVLFTVAIFRYRFLEILPIAKSRLIETISMPVLVLDGRGTIIELNPAACSLFGTKPHEAKGIPLRDLARQWPELLGFSSAEENTRQELVLDRGGETRYYSGTADLLRASNGDVEGRLIILQDISAKKQAEVEREEIARQSELALKAARLGWWNYHLASGRVTCNERFASIFRVAGEEPAVDELLALIHPDDLPVLREKMGSALDPADPTPYEIDYRVAAKDSVLRWVRANGMGIFGRDGRERHAVHLIGTVEDITDRKLAEEKLRETTEYLQNLITHANAPIIVWDPQFRITRFNHAFEDLTGRTEQEVLGQSLTVLFPDESMEASLRLIQKTLAGERWETVEIPILHVSGGVRTVLWNSANITSPDGILISTIAQGTDITERKHSEEQREALIHELEQKNAELERFTYTVSHDLKSPLITIKGFAGMLEEDIRKNDQENIRKDINRINVAAEKMSILLKEILELSRIGRIINPPENVAFGAIAREAVELLDGPIREKGILVTIEPDLPVVNIDHTRIREVIVNLVENAIRYMGDQPHPAVRIGVRYDEKTPVFYVQDNGIGIETQFHERIFNLFEKLDKTTEGSGAGLAIVRRIIEVHGGKIWVESEGTGKGSTFCFTLQGPG